MAKIRHMAQGTPLNEWFLDALQEELSDYVGGNFQVTQASSTSLQVVAGAGAGQVSIAVQNPAGSVLGFRHITATATAAVPGGLSAGTHDVYVIASANSFANNPTPPPNELDNTDYSFGLKLVQGGSTPSGSGSEAYYRKVGTFTWDGSKITGVNNTVTGGAGEMPVGAVADYAGANDPGANWMVCDGRAISRTTFAALFAQIGTTHGAGNGTTTFNIPDCRGRATVGVDGGAGRLAGADTLGAAGGEETHTISAGEMPSHSHGGVVSSVGDHSHGVSDPGHSHHTDEFGTTRFAVTTDLNLLGATGGQRFRITDWRDDTGSSTTGIAIQGAGGHNHGISADGGGGAHNNMQPYVVLNKIIRVA